jgi:hypothetical protein
MPARSVGDHDRVEVMTKNKFGSDPKPVMTQFFFWVMTGSGHDPKNNLGHDWFWVMTQISLWVMTGDPDHDPFL